MAELEAQIASALTDISGLEAQAATLTSGQERIDSEMDALESGLAETNVDITELAVRLFVVFFFKILKTFHFLNLEWSSVHLFGMGRME